jgi:anaerobic selenocysteine-containing dehydrogenase
MAQDKATQRIHGYCALCWSRCGCISTVEDGRLVAVEPDPDHPTGSALCAKGMAAPELVYHQDRLLYPMKRTRPKGDADPGWQRIEWDEALDTIAGELMRLSKESGRESIAFGITTPAATAMQDGFSWVERLRRAFGSPNAAIAMELCGFSRDMVFPHSFGVPLPMPDHARAGCILLWGHNSSTTWLAHATRVADARARGAKLVVVDPRHVGFAVKADQWLRVRPGSDGALALGLAGLMIAEGRFDRDFVRRWTNGPLLVRDDTGRFVSGADLDDGGDPTRRVAWDLARAAPVRYDCLSGTYERDDVDLALTGRIEIPGRDGLLACRPAFDLYASLCDQFPPERVEEITWVPADEIREAARLIGTSGPISFYVWAGLEMHTNASQTNRAIALLYALTGNFDAAGGNIRYETISTNDVMGADLLSEEMRGKALGLDERPLGPESQGWITTDALYDAILDERPYAVRALVNFGKNLLFSHADGARGARALQSLEFMVHADLFMNPTAEQADIFLPVGSAWEREGLCTDFLVDQQASAHVQLRPAVIEARGESRSDTWIAFALAERLGLGNLFWNGDVDAALRHQLAPSGIALEELRRNPGGLSVKMPTRHRKYAENADGTPIGFATPSKKVEIYSEVFLDHGYPPLPNYVEPAVGPGAAPELSTTYPLVLTSAKSPHFLQSQSRALPSLRRLEPDPLVEINPETAAERQISEGDWVALITPHGRIRAKARYSEKLHPKVVSAVHGWWEACDALSLPGYATNAPDGANLNAAIGNDAVDPIGGSVPHKSYLCQVERLAERQT